MIDFMSHLEESMLCKEMRSSPGVSGDMEELPSPTEETIPLVHYNSTAKHHSQKNFNQPIIHKIQRKPPNFVFINITTHAQER